MKKLFLLSLLTAVLCFSKAEGAIVTLTAQSIGETNGVAEYTISQYEVAELISFPSSYNRGSAFYAIKDGKSYYYTVNPADPNLTKFFDPFIITGPATLRLVAPTDYNARAICTVKITPEAYPPDRTLMVAPGTNQTAVTLEYSTNLVNWYTATNGVYGPLPEAKFFRIKAEPIR